MFLNSSRWDLNEIVDTTGGPIFGDEAIKFMFVYDNFVPLKYQLSSFLCFNI